MKWFDRILKKPEQHAEIQPNSESENGVPSHALSGGTVTGDNPIRRQEDDTLGRASAAQSFAQQVLSLDVREGSVVGVLGPWGSGKTSYINLARAEFERAGVPVLDFNPWMFSGAEQLVESFFVELSAQLKARPRLDEVGKRLQEYGEMFSGMTWLPVVGSWIERGTQAAKALGQTLQQRSEGIGGRRARLRDALIKLGKPIVVVLDDIDRLSTSEVRDMFKLVRLTASFPNVVYVVAFDRVRVEEALGEQGIPGRDYLEKILQVTVDLPAVPDQVLSRQVFAAVDEALAKVENPGPFDEQRWPDVFMETIRPLIRNMRDVRRYAAGVFGTVRGLKGEVALVDVLALEAVRVFLPEVFRRLHTTVDGLTTASGVMSGRREDSPHLKAQIDDLIKTAGVHGKLVRDMISRLFPAAERHVGGSHYGHDWRNRWLRDRRVAHEDILRLYLEGVAGEGLRAFTDAERAWGYITDADALDGFLRSLDSARLQDVIASLEVFEDEYAQSHVVPAASVLLNLLPDLPKRQRGMFDLDTRTVVARVVYRLVRSLKDPELIAAAVREISPRVKSLSSRIELIRIVGHREGVGHKLVSQAVAEEFERTWREQVRLAAVDELAKERRLGWVFALVKRGAETSEGPFSVPDSPQVTLAVLRDAQTETMSQSMGSRAVRRSPLLAWDALIELYGDEETLRERINNLKAREPENADDLLQLVDKYLAGWRPKDFGDE